MLDLLFALALAAAPQTAPAQDSGIVVEGEAKKPPKKVCKRFVPTGSVMAKVTCRTAAEWNAESDNAVAGLNQLRGEATARQHIQNSRALEDPTGKRPM